MKQEKICLSPEGWRQADVRIHILYEHEVDTLIGNRSDFSHPHYVFWRIKKGRVKVAGEGMEARDAGPGEMVFFFPNALRSQLFHKGTELLSLHISCKWPGGTELFSPPSDVQKSPPAILFLKPVSPWLELAGALEAMLPSVSPGSRTCSYEKYLLTEIHRQMMMLRFAEAMESLGCAVQGPARTDKRLSAVIRLLDEMVYSGETPYDCLCAAAGLSVPHLDRLFKRDLGITIKAYRDRRIMEKAAAALLGSGRSVKEIAYELGFSSLPHFDRWFRKHRGQTPGEYRRGAV